MPRIRLFRRRKQSDQPDLQRIATYLPPEEPAAATQSADVSLPSDGDTHLGHLRALSEEELFGAGGEDVTYSPVTGPRTPVPFIPTARPKGSEAETPGLEGGPPSRGLRSVWDANIPFSPPPDADLPAMPAAVTPKLEPLIAAEPVPAAREADAESPSNQVPTPLPDPPVPAASTMIGGDEADLVPLIPNTKPEAESAELDDETVAEATVEALRGACNLLVEGVGRLRHITDGGKFISAMIAVVAELDARYAQDWGIVRHNGLEELLNEVRAALAEGDRFILESLESGHGGLTDQAFMRDLKTVGLKDRPRIVAEYAIFLVFVYRCVLLQYMRPLEGDPRRRDDVVARLDYLIDGVREVLIQHVNSQIHA